MLELVVQEPGDRRGTQRKRDERIRLPREVGVVLDDRCRFADQSPACEIARSIDRDSNGLSHVLDVLAD